MALLMTVTTILTVVLLVLLVLLLYTYARNYLKFKAAFTVGLIIFAAVFLLQNAIALYYYVTMMEFYASGLELQTFLLTLLQTVAFSILLIITWE